MQCFIDEHELLSPYQYGFRRLHSTDHAILDIVNTIQSNMDKKLFSCGVFIDLQKAFDTVNHDILLQKLHFYGFRGIINTWFKSYLHGRLQTTQIGENICTKEHITCEVPQGSVLGPLLFLMYINDIHNCSQKFHFFLFADDTNLIYADKNLRALEKTVNDELKNVYDWLSSNKLSLNTKKSNFVIFHPYQKKLTYKPNINMFDNALKQNLSLECKDFIKYLGVLMDKNLTWKQHIEHVLSKISKTVGMIAKIRHFVPKHTLINIYNSLILPYLSYGLVIWGQACKTNWDCLLKLQKRALRFIHFAKKQDHAIPLFVNSKILPINCLYYEHVVNLMHNIRNKRAPEHILNLFRETSDIHSYRTRSSTSQNFYIEKSNLEIQRTAFSRIGAKWWNEIPSCIKELPKTSFKEKIRNIILNMLDKENRYTNTDNINKNVKSYS